MPEAAPLPRRALGGVAFVWRRLAAEQRVAAVAAVLLIVSTFGPFSFVEAATILTSLGVLLLLRQRAVGKTFHLPLGDGTVLLVAGLWAALLIVVRLLDRPLGQNLLALACAAILAGAGLVERSRAPADDLRGAASDPPGPEDEATRAIPPDETPTVPLERPDPRN